MQYTYLLINIGCILIPFLCSFYKKHAFYREWKYFFTSCIIVAIVFLVWDVIFTQKGIWGFNPDYLIGVTIVNLPLEEILFFICIPYACSFTFYAYNYIVPNKLHGSVLAKVNSILAILLLGASFLNFNRYYTFITFFTLGLFLLFLHLKKVNLYYYYLTFATIIPFFLISNGILTGSFLDAPIVWYNNHQNLGIRIFTIPIEDTFYGMLLIYSTIYLHQYLKEKDHAKN